MQPIVSLGLSIYLLQSVFIIPFRKHHLFFCCISWKTCICSSSNLFSWSYWLPVLLWYFCLGIILIPSYKCTTLNRSDLNIITFFHEKKCIPLFPLSIYIGTLQDVYILCSSISSKMKTIIMPTQRTLMRLIFVWGLKRLKVEHLD